VLLLGGSLLPELDGPPNRPAVEMMRYHAGVRSELGTGPAGAQFHHGEGRCNTRWAAAAILATNHSATGRTPDEIP